MNFDEKILKNGLRLSSRENSNIFGIIRRDQLNNNYEIKFWYKSVFQNIYHEDDINDAKRKLKALILNGVKKYKLDEKNTHIMKHIKLFENFDSKDLFETPELIPDDVMAILQTFDENGDDYQELSRVLEEVEKLGYTFEYYLDAEPYNLRKITT